VNKDIANLKVNVQKLNDARKMLSYISFWAVLNIDNLVDVHEKVIDQERNICNCQNELNIQFLKQFQIGGRDNISEIDSSFALYWLHYAIEWFDLQISKDFSLNI